MEFFAPANRTCGMIALGAGGLMIGVGYIVMQRISKIEV
jgi:hypothetical protein